MHKQEVIAMILAGGKGTRLGPLTKMISKPALPFGGKHRLIDFTLSNCYNSGINQIGVLMPPSAFEIHGGRQQTDSIGKKSSTVYPLLPRLNKNSPYKGTANALYENILFIEQFNPEFVLVLSGDHIYKMDYSALLQYHKEKKGALTIAVLGVPWNDASRFGIMTVDSEGAITAFTEKPAQPKSNLASMGVYVFTWSKLKEYLLQDNADNNSCHDFGKNIIPAMLSAQENIFAYQFKGYWKDVGTIESFYDAHMDLLGDSPAFTIHDARWPVFSTIPGQIDDIALISDLKSRCIYTNSCNIYGRVEGSILSSGVQLGKNVTIKNSIIMPGASICDGAYIERAIIGQGAVIGEGYTLCGGGDDAKHIAVVSENAVLNAALKWQVT